MIKFTTYVISDTTVDLADVVWLGVDERDTPVQYVDDADVYMPIVYRREKKTD